MILPLLLRHVRHVRHVRHDLRLGKLISPPTRARACLMSHYCTPLAIHHV
jgi:hypothetical protein